MIFIDYGITYSYAAPAHREGDMVLLSTRNIDSARPIPKFDSKFIGPFRIDRILNPYSYRLKLPHELDLIHNSFHTNHLRPSPNDPLPGQFNPSPPPITLDAKGEKLWAIGQILDSKRTKKNGFQHRILWRGFDPEEITWEPLHNVINAHAAIKSLSSATKRKLDPRNRRHRARACKLKEISKKWTKWSKGGPYVRECEGTVR
jgi:hypothetical protein